MSSFENPNIQQSSFETNLSLLEECLNNKEYEDALYYLWANLSILPNIHDEKKIERLLDLTVFLTPFLHYDDDYLFLIEKIDLECFKQNAVINSTFYFIKSVIYLNKHHLAKSYENAKLALQACQHAETISLHTICNAQLQVAFMSLVIKDFTMTEIYINKFNWYLETCKNDVERTFIFALTYFKKILTKSITKEELTWILSKLESGNSPFYPIFLLMHYKIVSKDYIEKDLYLLIAEAYYQKKHQIYPIIDEHFKKYHHFKSRYIKNIDLFINRSKDLFIYNVSNNESSLIFTIRIPDATQADLKTIFSLTKQINYIFYEVQQNEIIVFVSQGNYLKLLHALNETSLRYEILSNINIVTSEDHLQQCLHDLLAKYN